MTELALATRKPEVTNELQDRAKQEFVYHLSRTEYEKQFGNKYRRPGIFARILGFLIKLIPFGPAKVLGYRNPTPKADFRSMDRAIEQYRLLVHRVNRGNLEILNGNLDTGNQTRSSEYVLCDRTYPELLKRLANAHFRDLTPGVRTDMLASLRAGRLMTPSILVTGKK